MIVRMFKPQFAPLVESGQKKQTVRPRPKRMPKVGEEFSGREWTGKPYRSKQRELVQSTVTKVDEITVHPRAIYINGMVQTFAEEEQFARNDGFAKADFTSAGQFYQWFQANHDLPLDGIVIHWK